MRNTDSDRVDSDATSVKREPHDTGPSVYGSGLQAENDASNLAKMPNDRLVRELEDRERASDHGVDPEEMIAKAQAASRAHREVMARMIHMDEGQQRAIAHAIGCAFPMGSATWREFRALFRLEWVMELRTVPTGPRASSDTVAP